MGFFKSKSKCIRCGEQISRSLKNGLPTCTSCQLKIEKQKKYVRKCVVDQTDMNKELIENVVIDRCPTCGGIWFDPQELDIIRKAIQDECDTKYFIGLATGMAISS